MDDGIEGCSGLYALRVEVVSGGVFAEVKGEGSDWCRSVVLWSVISAAGASLLPPAYLFLASVCCILAAGLCR